MAKPIKATPTLTGEEANEFAKRMLKRQNSRVTYAEKRLALEVKELSRELMICA